MQQTKGREDFKAQDVEYDALVQFDLRNKVEIGKARRSENWLVEGFELSATIHLPWRDIIASQ